MDPLQRFPNLLLDLRTTPHEAVPATIIRNFPVSEIESVEAEWSPIRAAINEMRGGAIEHGHWDWHAKVDSIQSGRHRLIAVSSRGSIQGLMAVLGLPRSSRLEPSGSQLLYIDYIEKAPWNFERFPGRDYLGSVGTALIFEAIWLSIEMGFEGRIGLHSLPQAERFYRVNMGMHDLGNDLNYSSLRYFEYNSTAAMHQLKEAGL